MYSGHFCNVVTLQYKEDDLIVEVSAFHRYSLYACTCIRLFVNGIIIRKICNGRGYLLKDPMHVLFLTSLALGAHVPHAGLR